MSGHNTPSLAQQTREEEQQQLNHHHHHHHRGGHFLPRRPQQPNTTTNTVLFIFILLKILVSYDSGAFSAAIALDNGISTTLKLSVIEQGTLGSVVFLGNMVGCVLSGYLFQHYSPKTLISIGMLGHGCFSLFFGASSTYVLALVARFLIGLTLALVVVYSPIWVDEFAPKGKQATWLALCNAGVPVGIVLGFVAGGYIPTADESLSWRWPFYIKVMIMFPIVFVLTSIDASVVDITRRHPPASPRRKKKKDNQSASTNNNNSASPPLLRGDAAASAAQTTVVVVAPERQEEEEQQQASSIDAQEETGGDDDTTNGNSNVDDGDDDDDDILVFSQPRTWVRAARGYFGIVTEFLDNGIFISNLMTLSALYFVASALQVFITPYLRGYPFYASVNTIIIGFGIVILTAPVVGVIFGGVLLDRVLGGYRDASPVAVAKFQAWFGLCGAVFGCLSALVSNAYLFLFLVWVLLFFGGAVLPSATGLLISSVDEDYRPAASSFVAVSSNFLGYFLGPLVCGVLSDATGSLRFGVQVMLFSTVIGFFTMLWTIHVAMKANRRSSATQAPSSGDEDGSSRSSFSSGGNSPTNSTPLSNSKSNKRDNNGVVLQTIFASSDEHEHQPRHSTAAAADRSGDSGSACDDRSGT